MDIVFENYSTNYFENLTGKISQNCQIFSNKITLDKFIAVLMNVKYANGKMLILSLIHISEPTRLIIRSRMPSSA